MELKINGIPCVPVCGESLLQIVNRLGMSGAKLSQRPLAAKIAGEVFNLNYIPVREADAAADRPSIRTAMAASNGIVNLIRIGDPAGREVYTRTAQFVIFLALSQLWPNARAYMDCTLGPALFIHVENEPDFSAEKLKAQVQKLVEQDIPLIRKRISTEDAFALFEAQGREDQTRLLQWRDAPHFDLYSYGTVADYSY